MFPRSLQITLILASLVAGAAVVKESTASQYIFYNGTVSARTNWESSLLQEFWCEDVSMGPYENSYLYVGVNPPWDKNPFFFDLYHLSTEGGGVVVSFTKDRVYNLEFASAGLTCFSGANRCGTFEYTYHFVPDTALDLMKASVQEATISGDPGYIISGDSSAWISNGTLDVNSVDVDADCSQRNDVERVTQDIWDWDNTIWNNTLPFKWELSITNSSASFSITTTPPKNVGSMTISFSGKRTNSSLTAYPPQGVQLDTSDTEKPQFKFVDGNDIFFSNGSGMWRAYNNDQGTVEGPPSTSSSSTSMQRPISTTSTTSIPTSSTGTGAAAAATTTGAARKVAIPQCSTNIVMILGLAGLLVSGFGAVL